MGVEDETFDFVYSSHCLEHLSDPRAALRTWWRVLKPGGFLLIAVPDEDLYEQGQWPSKFNGDHKRSFTLNKDRSWSQASINILDLLNDLPDRKLISARVVDTGYNYAIEAGVDQTMGIAEAALEIVVKKVSSQRFGSHLFHTNSLPMPSSSPNRSRLASAESQPKVARAKSGLRFYHKPHLGDVVYSLPVMKHLGGGTLYLDPTSSYHEPFRQALSFFKRQSYVHDCQLYAGQEWDCNLDAYCNVSAHVNRHRFTIVNSHFVGIGLEPPKIVAPWLVAGRTEKRFPVVIHRSARYHGEVNYTFLHRIAPGDLYCVGYEDEVRMFRQAVGATWLPTSTLDELATIINASGVFIGNQSSPLAIAVGLGKARLIEECPWWPNCTYEHDNEIVMGMNAQMNYHNLCRLGYHAD